MTWGQRRLSHTKKEGDLMHAMDAIEPSFHDVVFLALEISSTSDRKHCLLLNALCVCVCVCVMNYLVYQANPSLIFLEGERWAGLID